MHETLLCFGDNACCLRTPPRVLGETFKEGPKHRNKGGKQLESESNP